MAKKLQLVLILSLLLTPILLTPRLAKAEDSSLNVIEALKKLPLKEGVTYDIKNKRFLNTLGYEVVTYKNFNVDVSYIGIDGLGATVNYSLSKLPVNNVPIMKYLAYLNVGYTVGYRTLALKELSDNPKSDNQLIQGPTVFVKINF